MAARRGAGAKYPAVPRDSPCRGMRECSCTSDQLSYTAPVAGSTHRPRNSWCCRSWSSKADTCSNPSPSGGGDRYGAKGLLTAGTGGAWGPLDGVQASWCARAAASTRVPPCAPVPSPRVVCGPSASCPKTLEDVAVPARMGGAVCPTVTPCMVPALLRGVHCVARSLDAAACHPRVGTSTPPWRTQAARRAGRLCATRLQTQCTGSRWPATTHPMP